MKNAILLFLMSAFYFAGYAQSIEEQVQELVKFHVLNESNILNANLTSVNQVGTNNNIVAIQQNEGPCLNYVYSQQQGQTNIGYIEQTGDAHATLLNQEGQGNEANLWSEGSLTYTQIDQTGSYNTINSYIDNHGLLPKAALLQQTGNNNSIDFALLGNGCLSDSWPKGAYIKQTGNDLEVTALFDSYQCPVYIEQQSGANGGMSINVSTTAFNFPMKKF
jgi:minor curlin subunit